MNKKNDELVKDFKSYLLEEVEGGNSKSKKEALSELLESFTDGYDPYSAAEKYLNTLNDDEFFHVFTAWSIGQEAMTLPEGFSQYLDSFESKEKLFEANLEELKTQFPSRELATEQFMSKKESFIKKCLDYYLDYSF